MLGIIKSLRLYFQRTLESLRQLGDLRDKQGKDVGQRHFIASSLTLLGDQSHV